MVLRINQIYFANFLIIFFTVVSTGAIILAIVDAATGTS